MKLNPNCMRDILLTVESNDGMLSSELESCPLLTNYSIDEIEYNSKQCKLSDLIVGYKSYIDGSFKIKALSPKGHNFLDSIRDENLFKKLLNSAKLLGNITLPKLIEMAVSNIL